MNHSPAFSVYLAGWACCSLDETLPGRLGFPAVLPDKRRIPASVRRRTSQAVQLALTAGLLACEDAGLNPADLPAVFASAGSEMQVTDRLCIELAKPDGWISPTLFHNSVHNTAAGYWSIVTGCQQPSTSLAAAEATVAMAWLEAWCRLQSGARSLLVVCYEEVWPDYLEPGVGLYPAALAWVLSDLPDNAKAILGRPEPSAAALEGDDARLAHECPALAAAPLFRAVSAGKTGGDMALGAGWSIPLKSCGADE